MVMTDPRLNIKAKGIYAYFCVWTGSGNSAFPRKESILNHLGITHNTYQRYYKQLIDCNYITVVQRRVKGVMSINDYYLNDNPDVEKLPDTKISDTEKSPDTKIDRITGYQNFGHGEITGYQFFGYRESGHNHKQ
jgi:DNA-binding transcriptional MocR family regulator